MFEDRESQYDDVVESLENHKFICDSCNAILPDVEVEHKFVVKRKMFHSGAQIGHVSPSFKDKALSSLSEQQINEAEEHESFRIVERVDWKCRVCGNVHKVV